MIRPLIYCETTAHVERSLETIDLRIKELLTLREQYQEKYDQLGAVIGLSTSIPRGKAYSFQDKDTQPINK